jgi:amino acid adenylation domain-containing protein
MTKKMQKNTQSGLEIAVIGMACRFPGAKNIHEFWNNLINGVESVWFSTDEEIKKSGIGPQLLENPQYVKTRGGILEGKEFFDAFFFEYTAREAEIMDPQMRIFHECSWEALEDAGYSSDFYRESIGLYAGSSSSFSWECLSLFSGKVSEIGEFSAINLVNKDFLTTRVSYKLDLQGPSSSIQTACSTSLVAIHMACRALLMGECKVALAGGVTAAPGEKKGYLHQEGMISSSDGHCRAFDARANGINGGNGVGVVVLKPLRNAIAVGDHIYAVIKGSAINNDGTRKIGFTAPAVKGQAEVIRAALRFSRVEPGSISYIETHGTGTPLGDQVEIEALKKAFNTDKKCFCAIGSVKTNIGHLDAAAGAAGFIKTVLALKHKQIPPSLHFETPHPALEIEDSPFYVNTCLTRWESSDFPLRAGVSSFGIGGTNVHVILEEVPTEIFDKEGTRGLAPLINAGTSKEYQLILLSAKSKSALEMMTLNLQEYLKRNPGIDLADAAYTLQVGRKNFPYRRKVLCSTTAEAITALSSSDSHRPTTTRVKQENPSVIFMFPGIGVQYVNMGWELYQNEPLFREEMDRCFEILNGLVDYNLKEILYPGNSVSELSRVSGVSRDSSHGSVQTPGTGDSPLERGIPDPSKGGGVNINQTDIAQVVIFIVEYALARLLIKLGIKPQAMIGYSFGEYTAACISGVFSLEDALDIIVSRGKLIETVSNGGMLSVPLSLKELKSLLNEKLSIAVDNGSSCIVSGSIEEIDAFEKHMKEKRYMCMRLQSSHAIHSRMMEPILNDFQQLVGKIQQNKPQIPYISNVTGDWFTSGNAPELGYWSRHLRETVRFADGIQELIKKDNVIFIELGPGRDLSALLRRYVDINSNRKIIDTLKPEEKEISDIYFLLNKIGQLWLWGVNIDWNQFYTQEKRQRISLPTYSFDRHYFSIERDLYEKGRGPGSLRSLLGKPPKMANWFYVPTWKRSILSIDETTDEMALLRWLVFIDEEGLGSRVVEAIKPRVREVITVQVGSRFSKLKDGEYTINPHEDHDYELLFNELSAMDRYPDNILHLWGVFNDEPNPFETWKIDKARDLGYYSLINTAKAIENSDFKGKIRFMVITNNMQEVLGKEQRYPEKAIILGPVKVIPLEYPNISCRSVDIMLSQPGAVEEGLLDKLLEEIKAKSTEPIVALRGNHRWTQTFEPVTLEESGKKRSLLRPGGVYLITGGLGGIGLVLAQHLAQSVQAKLVLMGRSDFPARNRWDEWLNNHNEKNVVSRKIQRLQSLEELGAKVLVLRADVSNQEQVQDAMKQVWEQFGQINGVIHAAGLPDGKVIQRRSGNDSEGIFAPKIKGTWILDGILKDEKLDFFILCSSTASIHGGIGQVAYCAANNFLDAFANYKHSVGSGFTVSINWERWQNVGIANIAEDLHKKLTGVDLSGGITSDEGVRRFSLILKDKLPQVIVTTRDLESLFQQSGSFKVPSLVEEFEETNNSKTLYQRPELQTEYIAPGNHTQQVLTDIWKEFFGFEQVGIADDFFELGGDSLKALFILPRIHKKLGVQLPVAEFFKRPTIHQLAEYIEQAEKSTYSSIEPVEKKEYYSLSSAQMRLYILQMMERGSVSYNEPEIKILEGHLSRDRFEEIFKRLIRRHECLRTSIDMVNGQPVQKIHRDYQVEFAVQFYETSEDEAKKLLKKFLKPFDLSQPPFLRAGLIKVGETKHILMLDMHHIITDVVSYEIFIKESIALYKDEKLPVLRLQYEDYAEWQKNVKIQETMKRQQEFWQKEFGGEIPVLNLPTDYERPAIQSFEGDFIIFTIGNEETKILKTLALKEGVTLYMVLLSVFNILVSKVSGQEDIIMGTPMAGRQHADLQDIMGFFINTLALRNYPAGEKTFKEFLYEVKINTLNVFENQDYPLEDLIEQVSLNRDMSRNPLFDVVFVLQNAAVEPGEESKVSTTGLKVSPYDYKRKTSKFDLTLVANEFADQLHFSLEYCVKLFKEETIVKFVGYFKNILQAIQKGVENRISQIEIISEAERYRQLVEFNDTQADFPKEKTIHGLFEEQVKRTPDHIALICENPKHLEGTRGLAPLSVPVSITYCQLNENSNQLAYLLQDKGVEPDTIVGIMVERSIEMIIGIMGILKAGSAYLPIDPEYPAERIRYMLSDPNVNILVKNSNIIIDLRSRQELFVLNFEHLNFELSIGRPRWGLSNLDIRISDLNASNLAYIIYTSGSTGRPKGVMVEHRNVVRLFFNDRCLFDFNNRDVWTLFHSYCFDFSVWEMYGALLHGGKLVINTQMVTRAPRIYLQVLKKCGVTILNHTPSAFYYLTDEELKSPDKALTLRYVIFGGEALNPGRLKKWRERYPETQLVNMYGITETTVHVTYKYIGAKEIETGRSNIGKPIPTLSTYVLDAQLQILPIGVPGEVCVGGKGVSRGYLNRPELTAEKFVTNPYQSTGRLYRSGDLARLLEPAGDLEYLGRIDHQVKIRGFRLELGEIEARLLQHHCIKEAVVIERKPGQEDPCLCAYIVPKNGMPIPELREYLSQYLPGYMIPPYIVSLDQIPLTANGKIDRKSLCTNRNILIPGRKYIAPGNQIEKAVAEVWKEVLQYDKIGINDSFFDLGGNSLKIIQLNTQLEALFKKDLSIATLFEYPTIHSFSQYLSQQKDGQILSGVERDRSVEINEGKNRVRKRIQKRGDEINGKG